MRQHPGAGKVGQCHALGGAVRLELLGDHQRLLPELRLQHALVATTRARALAGLSARSVFAGQHAARDGAVGHHADAMVGAHRQHLHLGLAVQQVVVRLADRRAGHVQRLGHVHHLGDAPAAEVGHAPGADLAGAQQRVHGAQRLFQVHAVVIAVQVVDVEVVGAQAPQAVLAGALDPAPRVVRLVGLGAHAVAQFAGQHPVAARAVLEQLTQQAFTATHRVDIGRIDEVHAVFAGVGQDIARLGQVGLVGKHHGAQAQGRDFQRALAQRTVLHGRHGVHGGPWSSVRALEGLIEPAPFNLHGSPSSFVPKCLDKLKANAVSRTGVSDQRHEHPRA